MIGNKPYLSFVVTSRNDDHGGNLLYRMQLFVDGLITQCNRFNLSAELILVEWNPPPERPRFCEALAWPADTGACNVRIIEVPEIIHRRVARSCNLPLFQMIGKNVGIRRARGEFILATNIDILFSDELMHFLSTGPLQKDRMYRVDRYDVGEDIPSDLSLPDQLKWCRDHVIRLNGPVGTVEIRDGVAVPAGKRSKPLRKIIGELFRGPELNLHTHACGDFTLLSKEKWQTVYAYPEFRMYSLYLDGLLCYQAHFAGAQEERLPDPMRIYHIEHAPGSGWSPGVGGDLLKERLLRAGVPQLDYMQYQVWVRKMKRTKMPILFNDDAWGLAGEDLEEWTIPADL